MWWLQTSNQQSVQHSPSSFTPRSYSLPAGLKYCEPSGNPRCIACTLCLVNKYLIASDLHCVGSRIIRVGSRFGSYLKYDMQWCTMQNTKSFSGMSLDRLAQTVRHFYAYQSLGGFPMAMLAYIQASTRSPHPQTECGAAPASTTTKGIHSHTRQ